MIGMHSPSQSMLPMAPMRRSARVLLFSSTVGTAALLAAPTTCFASLITYVFEDASTTLDGTPEVITGTFVFDPASTTYSSADVVLTSAAPYSDTYNRPRMVGEPSNVLSVSVTESPEPAFPRNLIITFADPLGTTADPIVSVQWASGSPGPRVLCRDRRQPRRLSRARPRDLNLGDDAAWLRGARLRRLSPAPETRGRSERLRTHLRAKEMTGVRAGA